MTRLTPSRRALVALLLVGTLLIAAWAALVIPSRYEASLQRRVNSVLAGSGLTGKVRGTDVELTGAIEDDPRRQVALQSLNELSGAVRVIDRTTGGRVSAGPSSAAPPLLRARFVNGRVSLDGLAPSASGKTVITSTIGAALGTERVDETLAIGPGVDPEFVGPFAKLVVAAYGQMNTGSLVVSGSNAVLLGTASSAAARRDLLSQAASLNRTWIVVDALRLPVLAAVDPDAEQSVNERLVATQSLLDNLIAGVPMKFDASGDLDSLSAVVLEEVARQFKDEEIVEATILVRIDRLTAEAAAARAAASTTLIPATSAVPEGTDVSTLPATTLTGKQTARAKRRAKRAAAAAARSSERSESDLAIAQTQARAQKIVGALKDLGVPAGKLSALGVGFERPRADEPDLTVRIVVVAPPPPTTLAPPSTKSTSTTTSRSKNPKRKR